MTAQLIKLQWHKPKVRALDWPTLYLPFNNYIIIKDGIEFTFRSIPIVTVSDNKASKTDKASKTEVLKNVIRRKFGIETFTSRQLSECAATDEELRLALGGQLDIPRIGTMLRDIKGIEAVDYERHVASWKVSPSRD
jgi:hypothetical protein